MTVLHRRIHCFLFAANALSFVIGSSPILTGMATGFGLVKRYQELDGPYDPRPTETEIEQILARFRETLTARQVTDPRRNLVIADRATHELLGRVSWCWLSPRKHSGCPLVSASLIPLSLDREWAMKPWDCGASTSLPRCLVSPG